MQLVSESVSQSVSYYRPTDIHLKTQGGKRFRAPCATLRLKTETVF